MNIHKNARLTLVRRREMVRALQNGERQCEVAERFGVSTNTARKWWRRFKADGDAGLVDKSSRPHHSPTATPPEVAERMLALRLCGLLGEEIAADVGCARSTVSKVLKSARLSRPGEHERDPTPVRYEHEKPGDMVHVDIKRLGKFDKPGHRVTGRGPNYKASKKGWEYVHVCVDDHSRVAYVEVLDEGETAEATSGFLKRAVAHFKSLGVVVKRVLSDNGPGYRSKLFRKTAKKLGVKHTRTRPYTPRTNGKAERFIQSMQREWAYVRPYANSRERRKALPKWVRRYNKVRPHGGIGKKPPMARMEASK